MERTGRIGPTFTDWIEASAIVSAIKEKDRGWPSKLPALLNDILIALCTRRVGATRNPSDEATSVSGKDCFAVLALTPPHDKS